MEPIEEDDLARVLVAVVTRPVDLARARTEGWYRIPYGRAPSDLSAEFVAWYQTGAFGAERWAVRWYAPLVRYQVALRRELLPAEAAHPRAAEPYYQLWLGPLQALEPPLPARRLRRFTFALTTLGALRRSGDLRELFAQPPPPEPPEIWGAGLAGQRLREQRE